MNKLSYLVSQFMKFGVVGVIAFVIDYGTMVFLTEVFGVPYLDTVNGQSQHQEMDPFSFAGEIDRIYWDAKGPLTLATAAGRTQITREGFDDVVVWNPGPARAAALADMPDDDWLQMLCVEAAQIGRPVTLAPGQDWVARQGFEV